MRLENDRLGRSIRHVYLRIHRRASLPHGLSSSQAERANYRPAAPGYACLPVTNAVALPPGGCYLRHQRDLRIVDPLSNHSNRRRPAGLIGSVYARSVRRRIAFNIPPSRVPDRTHLCESQRRGRKNGREKEETRDSPPAIIIPRQRSCSYHTVLLSPIMPTGNCRPRSPDYLRVGRRHADLVPASITAAGRVVPLSRPIDRSPDRSRCHLLARTFRMLRCCSRLTEYE